MLAAATNIMASPFTQPPSPLDSNNAYTESPQHHQPSPPKSSDFYTSSSHPAPPTTTTSNTSTSSTGLSASPTPAANSLLSSSPAASQSLAALSLSPSRTFPPEVGVHDTIIEEDDETDTDTPNEPVTPTSDRQSRETYHTNSHPKPEETTPIPQADPAAQPPQSQPQLSKNNSFFRLRSKHRRNTSDSAEPAPKPTRAARPTVATSDIASSPPKDSSFGLRPESPTGRPLTAVSGSFLIHPPTGPPSTADSNFLGHSPSTDTLQSPQNTRRSTTSIKSLFSFRRSNSQQERAAANNNYPEFSHSPPDSGFIEMAPSGHHKQSVTRRFSTHRQVAATQPNSPPSPGSPPDMPAGSRNLAIPGANSSEAGRGGSMAKSMPTQADFIHNDKQHRQRASTFQTAKHIVVAFSSKRTKKQTEAETHRRANSVDLANQDEDANNKIPNDLWILPANAGVGMKARRLSLSLPDDFNVDVVDLHQEFDYAYLMGRHRRRLGQGATSKVTLMYRKGFTDELYAVKEFRGKSSRESAEEYEKKVKSEYSLSKSLHHPNIVETLRLCTDHGRWNHVMEYCQEGDIFSLVSKRFFMGPEREKDRLCIFKQLIQGVNYLHQHGIAHRDIKLENLLITKDSKIKIADFGASDVFSGIHPGLREAGGRCGQYLDSQVRLCNPGVCGSLPYIAPEVLANDKPYDPRKLDVWSTAVCMVTIIGGGNLWNEARFKESDKGSNYYALVKGWQKFNAKQAAAKAAEEANGVDGVVSDTPAPAAPASAIAANQDGKTGRVVVDATPVSASNPNSIVEGPYPNVSWLDDFFNPPILRRVLVQMLNPDPDARPTIEQIAQLRWIRGIECCQPESYDDPNCCIDASKRSASNLAAKKIFFHNHLPTTSSSVRIV
ncbi:hal protein kinase [Ophiostoma piceae UAMH 11346]|uniref:Hal protein kinase n=1 Tax=Ophiostoma piceae (strain UAMH 11346) TaxID=1262450 RepID=S3BVK4_OPHP1|nr:hal protein kinase [Ophiostoma piceae UAMH 11346]